MTSTAQIEANRVNCLSSTGPQTPEGKQASSRNATSHGLSSIADPVLPHENRREFGVVARSYAYDFDPATAHEAYLVNEMAGARWRMARADRLLNIVLCDRLQEPEDNTPACNDPDNPEIRIARALAAKGDPIAKLERHRAAWERTYYRCVRELRAAQKFRASQTSQQNEPNPAQPPVASNTKTYTRPEPKIGRNDYCPCGSGLKYKKCCLKTSVEQFFPPAPSAAQAGFVPGSTSAGS